MVVAKLATLEHGGSRRGGEETKTSSSNSGEAASSSLQMEASGRVRLYHDEEAPSRTPATKPKEEGEFLLPLETAPMRGIYDNMKTAVETIFLGKDRQYNRRFLQMCSHHLLA
jgi:hypothetical protein